jgi:hypothetical protein
VGKGVRLSLVHPLLHVRLALKIRYIYLTLACSEKGVRLAQTMQIGPMHSCGNTAIKGCWSWPDFWANLASFSLKAARGGHCLTCLRADYGPRLPSAIDAYAQRVGPNAP